MTTAQQVAQSHALPASAALTPSWHTRSIEETLTLLGSTQTTGLDSSSAQAKREQYGANELRERPPTPFWQMLLQQFNNFLIIILLAAAFISLLLSDYIEARAIMAIVVLNAVLGVVQEAKAEQALATLKKMAAPEAKVIRDGHVVSTPASELVPGDIVLLETGNYVPADVRLLESVNLRIDEASLTGEQLNLAYVGTLVTYGRGKGVVVATAMRPISVRIAEMIQSYTGNEKMVTDAEFYCPREVV